MAGFLFLGFVSSAVAEDGFVSGNLYAGDDKIFAGTYVSLRVDGNLVYTRTYPSKRKDQHFSESFLVGGEKVLEIRHLGARVGYLFFSTKDYMVSTSVTDSVIDQISVFSVKEEKYHTWKRDAEGFYTDYRVKSGAASSPFF